MRETQPGASETRVVEGGRHAQADGGSVSFYRRWLAWKRGSPALVAASWCFVFSDNVGEIEAVEDGTDIALVSSGDSGGKTAPTHHPTELVVSRSKRG